MISTIHRPDIGASELANICTLMFSLPLYIHPNSKRWRVHEKRPFLPIIGCSRTKSYICLDNLAHIQALKINKFCAYLFGKLVSLFVWTLLVVITDNLVKFFFSMWP